MPRRGIDNTLNVLSVTAAALVVVCDAPVINVLKPAAGIVVMICEAARTARSNKSAVKELAKYATDVMGVVVERTRQSGSIVTTSKLEDDAMRLQCILEEIHLWILKFQKLNRKFLKRMIFAKRDKEDINDLQGKLDRALNLFTAATSSATNQNVETLVEIATTSQRRLDSILEAQESTADSRCDETPSSTQARLEKSKLYGGNESLLRLSEEWKSTKTLIKIGVFFFHPRSKLDDRTSIWLADFSY